MSLSLVAAAVLLWCAAGGLVYFGVRAMLHSHFDHALTAKARALATLLEMHPDGVLEFNFDDENMPEFSRAEHPEYFQIWRPDGSVEERSRSLRDSSLPAHVMTQRNELLQDLPLPDGRPGRAVWLRVLPQVPDELKEAMAGTPPMYRVTLAYARDGVELNETLGTLVATLGIASVPLGLATAGLVFYLVGHGLRPLSALAEQAERVEVPCLGRRIQPDSAPAELLPIYARLNDLLSRIDTAFQRERRFTSDVAHELRTPIAEIQALAEVALKWDPQAAHRSLQKIHDAAAGMHAMVSTLLALARCQWDRQALMIQSFDLVPTVRDVQRIFERSAADKRLNVMLDLPAAAIVQSDRAILKSILTNLWSNAVSHAPEGSTIECHVRQADQAWSVALSNCASSLTDADLQHIFDAFWRKDPARSNSLHSGLGLALVKAYSDLIGAQVAVKLHGGIFDISVEFPAEFSAPGPLPDACHIPPSPVD